MSILAIKRNESRPSDVIKLLEELGGKNSFNLTGLEAGLGFSISDHTGDVLRNICEGGLTLESCGYAAFTLDEFEKNFPIKTGQLAIVDGKTCEIVSMSWDIRKNEVAYMLAPLFSENLDECPFKMYASELSGLTIQDKTIDTMTEGTIKVDKNFFNGEQVVFNIPEGYEFAGIDDDKHQAIFERIKPKYPKTHNECCDVLGLPYMQLGVVGYKCETLLYLQKLLLYRDAYWKLAGDWRPNVEDEKQDKYAISNVGGKLSPEYYGSYNSILCFPTREVRDIFFETFKDEIEKCKELL